MTGFPPEANRAAAAELLERADFQRLPPDEREKIVHTVERFGDSTN